MKLHTAILKMYRCISSIDLNSVLTLFQDSRNICFVCDWNIFFASVCLQNISENRFSRLITIPCKPILNLIQ